MAKRNPPPPGKCAHCLCDFKTLTWDHVLPEGWYPSTTPGNIEKWKMPSCKRCNADHGKEEALLLQRIGLCLDPAERKSLGITDKALRAIDPRRGRDHKDALARAAQRRKVLSETLSGQEIRLDSTYPSFGLYSGAELSQQVAVTISAKAVNSLFMKIIKGVAYVCENTFIDDTYAINLRPIHDVDAGPFEDGLMRFGKIISCGPGLVIIRALVEGEKIIGLYKIEIWGRLRAYAVVTKKRI